MARAPADEGDDRVKRVIDKTDQVKDQLHDNINAMIERGEKLEDLNQKAENLETQAGIYEKKSKEVKDVMCWQSYRNLLIIFFLLAIIGLVIGLSIWGATK